MPSGKTYFTYEVRDTRIITELSQVTLPIIQKWFWDRITIEGEINGQPFTIFPDNYYEYYTFIGGENEEINFSVTTDDNNAASIFLNKLKKAFVPYKPYSSL